MIGACPAIPADIGVIRALLATTQCNVGNFSEAGYKFLTGPHALFPAAVTILLTIYVAVLGYRLLFGYGTPSLSDLPMIALKIGMVLALTLNWSVFQTLVLDVSTKAPLELASAIVGPQHAPLDRLQATYDELQTDQKAFAKLAQTSAGGQHSAEADAADDLSRAAEALLAATAGLLALATVVSGALAAIGPICVALFLFDAAGGLFAGWVRAITTAALLPALNWITTIILLGTLDPWLATLARQRDSQTLDAQTATVAATLVLVFAAAQVGLVIAAGIVAAGFRLPRRIVPAVARPVAGSLSGTQSPIADNSRVDQLVQALHRTGFERERNFGQAPSGNALFSMPPIAGQEISIRATRLGESYRRNPDWRARNRTVQGGL